eukprot:g2108.t1
MFQGELEGFFEKCRDISFVALETYLQDEFNVNDLWQKVFSTNWKSTLKNKRILIENVIKNCMIYLRSESIGRVDPNTVLKNFAGSVVLDLFEFVPIANIFVFLHMGEVTAAWVLIGCMIFERFIQILVALALEEFSFFSLFTTVLGIKTFITSYFIASLGPLGRLKGTKVYLVACRLLHKGVNGILISAPQTILNAYVVFSKLKAGEAITTLMRAQIVVILAVCFSIGASVTMLVQESERQHALSGYYISMTQIMSKDADALGMAILKGGWNICHTTLVSCALGALIAKTSPFVWGSIVIGYFVTLNIVRYVVNKGEIRYYVSLGSSFPATIASILLPMILYVFAVGLLPLSILRYHYALGPTVYGLGWISTALISSVSVLYLSSDIFLRVFFGVLIVMYVCLVMWYFRYLKPEARKSFLWSRVNWKDVLSSEWWDSPHYGSDWWMDVHLIGDKDANYAAMVQRFLSTDLPWNKLVPWLQGKKNTLKESPPTWLSIEWLQLIPKKQREKIWHAEEYAELCDEIRRVEEEFRRGNFESIVREDENDSNEDILERYQEKEKGRTNTANENTQEEQNALRQKVIENMKRRRSSFLGSVATLPLSNEPKEESIPIMLKDLFEKSETLTIDEIIKESNQALGNGLLDVLLGPEKDASADDIVLMIFKAFLRQRNERKKKDNITEGLPRILMAAFFELVDEISDIILAFLFYSEAGDVLWAAHFMFILIGLHRIMQFIIGKSLGQTWCTSLEGLIGIKTITDTYRLIRYGAQATRNGQSLSTLRGISLSVGIVFESLPQMMLQVVVVLSSFTNGNSGSPSTTNQTQIAGNATNATSTNYHHNTNVITSILIAQLVSVAVSSASIGLSMVSIHIDTATSLNVPGKLMHSNLFCRLQSRDSARDKRGCFVFNHDTPRLWSKRNNYNTTSDLLQLLADRSHPLRPYFTRPNVTVYFALCFKNIPTDICGKLGKLNPFANDWLGLVDELVSSYLKLRKEQPELNVEFILDSGVPQTCFIQRWRPLVSTSGPYPNGFHSNNKSKGYDRWQVLNGQWPNGDFTKYANAKWGKFVNSSYAFQVWEPSNQKDFLAAAQTYLDAGVDHPQGLKFAINVDVAMSEVYLSQRTGRGINEEIAPNGTLSARLVSLDKEILLYTYLSPRELGQRQEEDISGSRMTNSAQVMYGTRSTTTTTEANNTGRLRITSKPLEGWLDVENPPISLSSNRQGNLVLAANADGRARFYEFNSTTKSLNPYNKYSIITSSKDSASESSYLNLMLPSNCQHLDVSIVVKSIMPFNDSWSSVDAKKRKTSRIEKGKTTRIEKGGKTTRTESIQVELVQSFVNATSNHIYGIIYSIILNPVNRSVQIVHELTTAPIKLGSLSMNVANNKVVSGNVIGLRTSSKNITVVSLCEDKEKDAVLRLSFIDFISNTTINSQGDYIVGVGQLPTLALKVIPATSETNNVFRRNFTLDNSLTLDDSIVLAASFTDTFCPNNEMQNKRTTPASCDQIPYSIPGVLGYALGPLTSWRKIAKLRKPFSHCSEDLLHGAFSQGTDPSIALYSKKDQNQVERGKRKGRTAASSVTTDESIDTRGVDSTVTDHIAVACLHGSYTGNDPNKCGMPSSSSGQGLGHGVILDAWSFTVPR